MLFFILLNLIIYGIAPNNIDFIKKVKEDLLEPQRNEQISPSNQLEQYLLIFPEKDKKENDNQEEEEEEKIHPQWVELQDDRFTKYIINQSGISGPALLLIRKLVSNGEDWLYVNSINHLFLRYLSFDNYKSLIPKSSNLEDYLKLFKIFCTILEKKVWPIIEDWINQQDEGIREEFQKNFTDIKKALYKESFYSIDFYNNPTKTFKQKLNEFNKNKLNDPNEINASELLKSFVQMTPEGVFLEEINFFNIEETSYMILIGEYFDTIDPELKLIDKKLDEDLNKDTKVHLIALLIYYDSINNLEKQQQIIQKLNDQNIDEKVKKIINEKKKEQPFKENEENQEKQKIKLEIESNFKLFSEQLIEALKNGTGIRPSQLKIAQTISTLNTTNNSNSLHFKKPLETYCYFRNLDKNKDTEALEVVFVHETELEKDTPNLEMFLNKKMSETTMTQHKKEVFFLDIIKKILPQLKSLKKKNALHMDLFCKNILIKENPQTHEIEELILIDFDTCKNSSDLLTPSYLDLTIIAEIAILIFSQELLSKSKKIEEQLILTPNYFLDFFLSSFHIESWIQDENLIEMLYQIKQQIYNKKFETNQLMIPQLKNNLELNTPQFKRKADTLTIEETPILISENLFPQQAKELIQDAFKKTTINLRKKNDPDDLWENDYSFLNIAKNEGIKINPLRSMQHFIFSFNLPKERNNKNTLKQDDNFDLDDNLNQDDLFDLDDNLNQDDLFDLDDNLNQKDDLFDLDDDKYSDDKNQQTKVNDEEECLFIPLAKRSKKGFLYQKESIITESYPHLLKHLALLIDTLNKNDLLYTHPIQNTSLCITTIDPTQLCKKTNAYRYNIYIIMEWMIKEKTHSIDISETENLSILEYYKYLELKFKQLLEEKDLDPIFHSIGTIIYKIIKYPPENKDKSLKQTESLIQMIEVLIREEEKIELEEVQEVEVEVEVEENVNLPFIPLQPLIQKRGKFFKKSKIHA